MVQKAYLGRSQCRNLELWSCFAPFGLMICDLRAICSEVQRDDYVMWRHIEVLLVAKLILALVRTTGGQTNYFAVALRAANAQPAINQPLCLVAKPFW